MSRFGGTAAILAVILAGCASTANRVIDDKAIAEIEEKARIDRERKIAEFDREFNRQIKAEKAKEQNSCKVKGGVRVGMTRQQVYDSCWGRPKRINSTITARGTREQLVYPGGYLYLDDGILTAIQLSE